MVRRPVRRPIGPSLVTLGLSLAILCSCGDNTPPDATADASAPDARAADATSPGLDAGPTDAAGPDADLTGAELPPEVTVAFPTPTSFTDSPMLTVRGMASDVTAVAEIRVNGVLATTSDGFASWTAEVPLQQGANTLRVRAEDDQGNIEPNAAQLSVTHQQTILGYPGIIAWDGAHNRALLGDWGIDAVLAAYRSTGAIDVISSAEVGSGEEMDAPQAMEMSPTSGHAYVLSAFSDNLLDVDLATGDRSLVSDLLDPAAGPVISNAKQLALQGPQRAFIASQGTVYDVDLTTGMRSVVASNTLGTGPSFFILGDLVYDPARDRVLVGNGGELLSIDPATGDRIVSSGPGVGAGPAFQTVFSAVLDPLGDRVFFTDVGTDALFELDLATGDRTVVSDAIIGDGPMWSIPSGIARDPSSGRLMVADHYVDTVFEIDPVTGDRTIMASTALGQGFELRETVAVRWDIPNERAFAITNKSVFEISMVHGDRRTIAEDIAGIGEPQRGLMSMVPDLANNRLYVPNYRENLLEIVNQLFAIDITTGALTEFTPSGSWSASGRVEYDPSVGLLFTQRSFGRVSRLDWATGDATLLSSYANPMLGDGPELKFVGHQRLDLARNRLLVNTTGATPGVYAVDLTSGDRTVLASEAVGDNGGLPYYSVGQFALDDDDDRLVAVHNLYGTLMSIDLQTGDRSVLASAETGSGPVVQWGFAMDIDPELDRAIVVDHDGSALILIDLHTGARVIVAR